MMGRFTREQTQAIEELIRTVEKEWPKILTDETNMIFVSSEEKGGFYIGFSDGDTEHLSEMATRVGLQFLVTHIDFKKSKMPNGQSFIDYGKN